MSGQCQPTESDTGMVVAYVPILIKGGKAEATRAKDEDIDREFVEEREGEQFAAANEPRFISKILRTKILRLPEKFRKPSISGVIGAHAAC